MTETKEQRYEKLTQTESQLFSLVNIVEQSEKSAVANCRDSNMTHRLKNVIATLDEEDDLPAALAQDLSWLKGFLAGRPQFVGKFQEIAGKVIKFREKKYGEKAKQKS